MGFDAKTGFSGIVTATAEVTGDATGLRVADNVTLRKEGALTLRSTFGSSALVASFNAAFAYRGTMIYLNAANSVYSATGAVGIGGQVGGTQPALRADIASAEEARGNLYIASRAGVFKLTAAPPTTYIPAGLPVAASIASVSAVTTGTPLIMASGQRVAYRVVAKYTDANGVVLRSRPSSSYVFDAATNCSPQINISSRAYYDNVTLGEVEVYRTRIFSSTVSADDEMQLVGVATPVTFGSVTLVDRTADIDRGTTLYTSPSRGGIENANDRAPGCACIETYRGSLFFGNTVGPRRMVLSYALAKNVTGSVTGIGQRTATANWSNGSNQLTSVSNTTGVQIGMLVTFGSTYYSPGSPWIWVTAIAGSTITLNAVATASAAAGAVTFNDTIQVSSGVSFSVLPSGTTPWNYVQAPSGQGIESSLADPTNNIYRLTPSTGGYGQTLVLEAGIRGSGGTLAVRATHGDEYNPPVALATSSTGTVASFDTIENGLSWSEPQEPEHVPPKNFARVGDQGKQILALIATKDRLLIFKEDGLFMLTGDTAKNFGIYPLDTTCLCILPGSVRRLQNTVYALTNLGLVAVDEGGGVTVVSRSIQTELAPIVTQIRQAQASSGLYLMPGLSGVTGTSDDPNGEYWLMLGTTTPSFGGQMLVWNAFRRGFTTFNFGTPTPVCVAQDGSGQPLVLTASTLLTPSTSLGVIVARVSPRAFSDPALVGKFWSHIVAGFSQLTGTTNVQAKFAASESMVAGASVTEPFDLPLDAGTSLLQFPLGSLLRHPVPSAFRRAYMLVIELTLNVASGTFTLETIAAESRQNISNKEPLHGSGAS